MPTDDDLPAGTVIAGRYRVIRTAGSGGMGVVYVVEHVNTGGRAALKLMRGHSNQRAVERFRREARASAIIQSDHVVRVTDADVATELEDAPFLVMELLHGEDLADRMNREGRLGAAATIEILGQVARGLERAHAAGVVHRDLKPQNIFLHQREDGAVTVKIVDFGISRIQHKADGREVTGLTRAEDIFGTPSWMSPEQAMSMHHEVGPATDVWAVGLLAFKMLHGESYWGDREAPQILAALMMADRTPPSELDPTLPPAFDRWFIKSCSREPSKRFQNAIEQVEGLAAALSVEAPARFVPTPSLGIPVARDSDHEPTPVTGGLELTPATSVNHPIASARTAPAGSLKDFGSDEDEEGPTAHLKKAGGKALAKPPALVRPLDPMTPDPITPDPMTPAPISPEVAFDLDPLDPPTTPKRPKYHSETAQMPIASVLTPSPSDRGMQAFFVPPKPEAPAWAQHLVWILPTLIFGGVFIAGLVWLLAPEPPLPTAAPARSVAVAAAPPPPQSASAVESAAPPVEELSGAPVSSPTVKPPTKPKKTPARHDAFDTQK